MKAKPFNLNKPKVNDMKKYILHSLSLMTLLIGLSITIPAWAGSADYVYDDLGRLVAINYDDGTTITYSYDNTGNRITRTVVKL